MITSLAMVVACAGAQGEPQMPVPALAQHSVPGLTIEVPAWTADEAHVGASPGSLKLGQPSGTGRMVELRWRPGATLTSEQLVDEFQRGLGVVVERTDETVDSHPAVTLYGEPPGKAVAITRWICPQTELTFTLTTFVSLARAGLLALHRDMLASARCVAASLPTPVYAEFTPPLGFIETANADERTWVGPGGEQVSLLPGIASRSSTDSPDLGAIGRAVGLTNVAPAGDVEVHGSDGVVRTARQATARHAEFGAITLAAAPLVCDGKLFVAVYFRPDASPGLGNAEVFAMLGCPAAK